MLFYIYTIFHSFRPFFSRKVAWLHFCSVVLGMIACMEMGGVSSLCRFWHMNEQGYLSLLHFFRASSWNHLTLMNHWTRYVIQKGPVLNNKGRLLMLADHTYQPKDGRRMPGVVTLHQKSETQSKPSFFRGQCWAVLSMVIGSKEGYFSLPVLAKLDQGYAHLKQTPELSQSQRPVALAQDFAWEQQKPVLLVLDAYFGTEPVFEQAKSICDENEKPWVEVITKAKKNYVARTEQGETIHLSKEFETEGFHLADCQLYGHLENVAFKVRNLSWGKSRPIRFIWVKSRLGKMVLMCSNLDQEPIKAIEAYGLRMKIEVMFDRLKNLLGAFEFHFWTQKLPSHSRRPKKNNALKEPDTVDLKKVELCWLAYERFVNLGCIALGVLQLLAVGFPEQIWQNFQSFLRTRRNTLPSERVVRFVLAKHIQQQLGKVTSGATLRQIHDYHKNAGFLDPPLEEDCEVLCPLSYTA